MPRRCASSTMAGDIGQAQQRVGGRLEPDQARGRQQRGLDGGQVGHIDHGEGQAEALPFALEEPVGAAIDVAAHQHVVAGRQQAHHRIGGGHARAQRPYNARPLRASPGSSPGRRVSGWTCACSHSPCARRPGRAHRSRSGRWGSRWRRWPGRAAARRESPASRKCRCRLCYTSWYSSGPGLRSGQTKTALLVEDEQGGPECAGGFTFAWHKKSPNRG